MILFISISFFFLCLLLDGSFKKIYSLSGYLVLFSYSLTLFLLEQGGLSELQVKDSVSLSLIHYIFFILIHFAYILPVLVFHKSHCTLYKQVQRDVDFSLHKLEVIAVIFSVFVVLVTVFNYSTVPGGYSLLFLHPRTYELTFGQSTLRNYIYFLNVITPSIYLYLFKYKSMRFGLMHKVLFLLVISSGVLFGHKSAFIDIIVVTGFSYYIIFGFNLKLVSLGVVTASFIIFYFTEVRGGESGVFGYLVQGSVNLIYRLQEGFLFSDPISLFWRGIGGEIFEFVSSTFPFGFPLNDKYNTVTGLYNLWAFGRAPAIFIYYILIYFVFVSRLPNYIIRVPFYSMVGLLNVMMFFSFRWGAFKYLYLFVILIALGLFCCVKKKRIT